jgi:hypothetical protein
MSANGTKRTLRVALHMSAFGGNADIEAVCFFYVSNSLANASAKAGSAKHHRI